MNAASDASSSRLPPSTSHMRARWRASSTSSSGASAADASAITIAQRRTVAVPSSVSASRTDSTVRGSAKNAELM